MPVLSFVKPVLGWQRLWVMVGIVSLVATLFGALYIVRRWKEYSSPACPAITDETRSFLAAWTHGSVMFLALMVPFAYAERDSLPQGIFCTILPDFQADQTRLLGIDQEDIADQDSTVGRR